jgi:Rhs element Vgr protein
MPAPRTLPIAAEHREFTVKVDGSAVPRQHQLQAVSVVATANRIASARLVYVDGEAAAGSFPLGDSPLFVPGAAVEVRAGTGRDSTLVFEGVVVGRRLKVREAAAPQLVIECRHGAFKLALARRSAMFFDQTDAEVIESLLGGAGLAAEVESTTVTHKQLVQHDCSDWDFVVARAQANGALVLTRGADLAVRKPALTGSSMATLQFGATVLEFDAEIDARAQAQAAQTLAWSAADQAVHTQDGEAPSFTPPGNLETDALAEGAGSESVELRHAAIDDEQATALASAWLQRARVNQVSGRAKCHGIATVQPGDVVELAGVGERFNGRVLVTAVRQELDTVQGWKTHLQFGGVEPDEALRQRLSTRRTAAMLAPVSGLQTGIVTDNEDPDGEFRVRVRLPLVDGGDGVWARVAALDAGAERGFLIRPEIGDEVVLGFLDDDPRHPVLLGMLHSSAKAAPLAPSNDNHEKAFVSRSGMRVHFDDDQKVLTVSTPGGHQLVMDEAAQTLLIEDQSGNKIEMSSSGITIESATALTLKSGTDGTLQAGTTLALEGSASAELKSGGTTTLSGSAVQLN